MDEDYSMKFKLLTNIVRRQFVSQRHLLVPFIITTSVIFMIVYILLSMAMNSYLYKYQPTFIAFSSISNIFITFLGIVFIFQANRAIMRQRDKSITLYIMLGMEKYHVYLMMFIETIFQIIIISMISIIGGYLFGALLFMIVQKTIGASSISLTHYPVNDTSIITVIIMITIIMSMLLIFNILRLNFKRPSAHSSAILIIFKKLFRPAWVKYVLFVIAMITLGIGYYTAMQRTTVIGSFPKLLLALCYVVIGTYVLFISFSKIIIDLLQRIPKLYYHSKYFFVIIGLRMRLKSNAMSLASIALLCASLIIILTMTVTTYRGMDKGLNHIFVNQYEAVFSGAHNKPSEIKAFEQEVNRHVYTDSFKVYQKELFTARLVHNRGQIKLQPSTHLDAKTYLGFEDGVMGKSILLTVMSVQDYNRYHPTVQLANNELATLTSVPLLKQQQQIAIGNKKYHIKHLNKSNINLITINDSLVVLTPNVKQRDAFINYFVKAHAPTSTNVEFNILEHKTLSSKFISHLEDKYDVVMTKQSEMQKVWLQLNGGLLFLGVSVSLMLVIGLFLMMYYKQTSEGSADQQTYKTMTQVGMEISWIHKIIQSQIVWLFLIPISIAIIHTLFANRLIFTLLNMVGITEFGNFATSYVAATIIVVIIYLIMYWITSRLYIVMVQKSKSTNE